MIRYCIALALTLPTFVFAAEPTGVMQDYKCHVTTTNGDKVLFYRWWVKDVNLSMASLPGTQKVGGDEKKFFIKEVVECVELSKEFTNENSKKIDELTLR
ncbi:TapY2 family type IVa secretion system protein [Shewanella seohaensis]|uniref:TapY2 family type IVa secretion system protein n=1 Tax=Shewanella seohaensis TaxID=755175 RepID=UPI0035BA3A6F